MKIINEPLLDTYRTPGRCDFCKRDCRAREPHHLWAHGKGGGYRLDVPINLISLGKVWQCQCHRELHDGNLEHAAMLAVVATRENTFQDHIERVIYMLRRLPKSPRPWEVEREVVGMGAERELGLRVLRECGLLFEGE